ncbi:MAG: type IV pilin-like G/H family protein [Jaaginema sp. PMC 1079.18]|nr:type IV pilin-like G/H family protein [Jaaginema sp. PMC 1080.18]MEC4850946.1 type IV pilin-like G/H family protein [Jaaginema sp. PMC 1079.18]MEC4867066.1 type IV pilin-like G/H family protein [Jaaginema sp. PMC 1078.18]
MNRFCVGLFLSSLLGLGGCQLNIQAPKIDGETQAKFYMQAIAKGQQAYYQANGNFASSLDTLALDFNLETPDYYYSLVSEGKSSHRTIITATAKVDNLPSYAGIMVMETTNESLDAIANFCQTVEPSKIAPVFPSQIPTDRIIDCPPGSVPVQ